MVRESSGPNTPEQGRADWALRDCSDSRASNSVPLFGLYSGFYHLLL